ncbi:multidrug efflux SMR transporter [Jiella endophytica]|uniref:Guanidinium exporter n=1 Tax=Jiella endophytica TaxID=2558362 RepID=A0A4Y8RQ60_9HYPH|nr:multidrug efflux SMR transporter [Jiella endophytica]TFF25486.1 multidrug efflux SMR transporter [Jiella endophytica]
MAWVALFLAGILEVAWALAMKWSEGFTRPLASVVTVLLIIVSLTLLNWSLKSLPVGTAYGVWAGIGTIGTAAMGIALFGEPANLLRLGCIAMIAAGIVGLKLIAME